MSTAAVDTQSQATGSEAIDGSLPASRNTQPTTSNDGEDGGSSSAAGGSDGENGGGGGGFFDGFDVWKMVGAGAVGCAIGLGYSVIDQTVLHKPKKSVLPYTSDLLHTHMPDVLERAEKFYEHRRLVSGTRARREFDRLMREMLKQSEYFAAIYAQIVSDHTKSGGVTPGGLERHFRYKTQAKGHWDVIVQLMRSMSVLVATKDNLMVENDFNRLYEAFHSRFYMIHQHVLGAV